MAGPVNGGELTGGAVVPKPPELNRLPAREGLKAALGGTLAKTATAAKFAGWLALLVYLAVYGWHVGEDWLETGGIPTLDITELSKAGEGSAGDMQSGSAGFAPCPLGEAVVGLAGALHGAAFCSLEDVMVAWFPKPWGWLEARAHSKPGSGADGQPAKAVEQLADLQAQLGNLNRLIAEPPPALAHPLQDEPPAQGLLEKYLGELKGSSSKVLESAASLKHALAEFKGVEEQLEEIKKLTADSAGPAAKDTGAASPKEAGERIQRYLAEMKGPSSKALESVTSIRQALAEPASEPPTPGAQMLITTAANVPLSLLLVMAAAWLERRFAKA